MLQEHACKQYQRQIALHLAQGRFHQIVRMPSCLPEFKLKILSEARRFFCNNAVLRTKFLLPGAPKRGPEIQQLLFDSLALVLPAPPKPLLLRRSTPLAVPSCRRWTYRCSPLWLPPPPSKRRSACSESTTP